MIWDGNPHRDKALGDARESCAVKYGSTGIFLNLASRRTAHTSYSPSLSPSPSRQPGSLVLGSARRHPPATAAALNAASVGGGGGRGASLLQPRVEKADPSYDAIGAGGGSG